LQTTDSSKQRSSCPFNKRDLVCQDGLQKNPNSVMSGYAGRFYEYGVLGNPKMGQVASLG
jgi:hypothetical protein